MKQFTALFEALDSSTRTNDKVSALVSYFSRASDEDSAWALHFLGGRKVRRALTTTKLRQWAAEEATLPTWLLEESYDVVGDLAETISLLLPGGAPTDAPFSVLIAQRLLPLRQLDDAAQRQLLLDTWRAMDAPQRLVWNKLLTGGFRVGVARTLVARALAKLANVDQAEMAHRLMGDLPPTAEGYRRLLTGEGLDQGPGKPYPFCLAQPLAQELNALGAPASFRAEWKWDGIRAQVVKRRGMMMIWSRGEELVTDRFPELASLEDLPDNTVLDGEILAWKEGAPMAFGDLQRRLGRKTVGAKLRADVPVIFMAYDILESGEDCRQQPFDQRREQLEQLAAKTSVDLPLSPQVSFASWAELADLRQTSRERCVEGLMLKRANAPYGVGRCTGLWWKWKIDPHTVDAVLMYAQRGHGRRANLYTDYTFGVWHDGQLVPVAKAYSGLTDDEMREVNRFVHQNTLDKHGPVRVVRPELVFEVAFEGIWASRRHKSGIAVRFPRMARFRRDKRATEADSLQTLHQLLPTAIAP